MLAINSVLSKARDLLALEEFLRFAQDDVSKINDFWRSLANCKQTLVKLIIFYLAFCFIHSTAFGMEQLLYVIRKESADKTQSTVEFFDQFKKIYHLFDIVISQAYRVTDDGTVEGTIDHHFLSFVHKHKIKLMPLVTNASFDEKKVHLFLQDLAAQHKVISKLLAEAKRYHYYGFQLDFEHVFAKDGPALTKFYKQFAETLHKNHFATSITIIPRISDVPHTKYHQLQFAEWNGAYDYTALAAASDFVTLMTYDQHYDTPGPIASYPWVESAIQYALHYIPAKKISLGMPAYSDYWYSRVSKNKLHRYVYLDLVQISYDLVNTLLKRFKLKLQWNDTEKIPYVIFQHHYLNEYLYPENARSLSAKLPLIAKYHLRGISLWRLGTEDPDIWKILRKDSPQTTQQAKQRSN